MKKLLAVLALLPSLVWGQVNPSYVQGQVLTASSLNFNFSLAAAVTNGTLTSPTITNGTATGLLLNTSTFTGGTINGATVLGISLPLTELASQAANTLVANGTGSAGSPTALAIPSCSTASSALNWTTSGGAAALTCNTAINASSLGGNAAATYAPLASPTFTGTPAAPTAAAGTNTTQIATTANVVSNFATPPAAGYGSSTPEPVAATTISATGLISPTSTIGVKGTTTNDNAQAGSVGECIPVGCGPTSTIGTSVSSNTPTNCTSVPLTAGQWLVWGQVLFVPSAVLAQIVASINTVSATLPAAGFYQSLAASFTSANTQALTAQAQILKLASTTTVYIVAQANITSGTLTCNGYLWATRIR